MVYKKSKFRWLLFPFALLYGLVVSIRNRLFDYDILEAREFDIPVISVGNITVGGTGKTPHVEYLVALLKDHFNVVTLSRGYKRKTKGFLIADKDSTVQEIGDEPKQIKMKFPDVNVTVDKKRVNGIEHIISDSFPEKADVVVLDDAYQHRWVKPGINILLIDYNRPLSEDFLLPVGTLRERPFRKNRANIIIMAKSPEKIKPIEQRIILKRLKLFPYQSLYFSTFNYLEPKPIFENSVNNQRKITKKTSVLLITGIAYPKPLKEYIQTMCSRIEHIAFSDHHEYKQTDIESIKEALADINGNDKLILTTEKDAVRLVENQYLSDELKLNLFYIPIAIQFLKEEDKVFNKQIIDYVRKNKRNHSLHKI